MLYLVSTPIGNLEDISFRAISTLKSVHYIFAEDTRKTKKLLNEYKIKTSLMSMHEHNENDATKKAISILKDDKDIALVSDAGSPMISDPGYILVRECIKESIAYTFIPGASSVISSLLMSGLPTSKFMFLGFLPKKNNEKKNLLEKVSHYPHTTIFFESPKRLFKTLTIIKDLSKLKKISICRELTKIHEEVLRGTAEELIKNNNLENKNLKGELVIVIEGNSSNNILESSFIKDEIIKELLRHLSPSKAAKILSGISGINKREIYLRISNLQK